MKLLIIQIIGGLIVAIIAAVFGVGRSTRVVVQGGRTRKSGKWLVLISVAMILGGFAWIGSDNPNGLEDWVKSPGFILLGYGVLFYIVGRIVAWFQKP